MEDLEVRDYKQGGKKKEVIEKSQFFDSIIFDNFHSDRKWKG